MSNVVEFVPFEEAPVVASAAPQRRLLLLSRGLALLFTALLGLVVLWMLAGLVVTLFFGAHVLMGPNGLDVAFGPHGGIPRTAPGQVRLSDLPAITRVAGAAGWLIVNAPVFAIFAHLRRLFGLYAGGTVFARANATHIKRIGLWLIAYPVANYFCNALFALAGGADRASWFHFAQIEAVLLGLIVFAIAQVMAFGREIEQERDSFI